MIHNPPVLPTIVLILALAGCDGGSGNRGADGGSDARRGDGGGAQAPPESAAAEFAQTLPNATYRSAYVAAGAVQLSAGRYESADPPVVVTLLEPLALGDLNGDGADDAAVILATNTDGSGVFVDLAAVINDGGSPRNVAVAFLGDRIRVEGVAIEEGEIELRVIMHGPDEPLCCPTVRAIRRFRLQAGGLIEVDPPVGFEPLAE